MLAQAVNEARDLPALDAITTGKPHDHAEAHQTTPLETNKRLSHLPKQAKAPGVATRFPPSHLKSVMQSRCGYSR